MDSAKVGKSPLIFDQSLNDAIEWRLRFLLFSVMASNLVFSVVFDEDIDTEICLSVRTSVRERALQSMAGLPLRTVPGGCARTARDTEDFARSRARSRSDAFSHRSRRRERGGAPECAGGRFVLRLRGRRRYAPGDNQCCSLCIDYDPTRGNQSSVSYG